MYVAHFYGWTLDDLRKLTVPEYEAAKVTMGRIRRERAKSGWPV